MITFLGDIIHPITICLSFIEDFCTSIQENVNSDNPEGVGLKERIFIFYFLLFNTI